MSTFAKTLSLSWFYFLSHVKAVSRGFAQAHGRGLIDNLKLGIRDHRAELQGSTSAQFRSEVVHRTVDAYRATKKAQPLAEKPYQVGKLWQSIIEREWDPIFRALEVDDFDTIGSLLGNFNRLSFSRSTGGGYGDARTLEKHPILYRYLLIDLWCRYREICKRKGIELTDLSWPLTGNTIGVKVGEHVLPHDVFRHAYYAKEFTDLLRDVDHPIICEIGGGVGGQAYVTHKMFRRDMTYILVDLPESLIVSSYFLQMSLPGKRILLFGEQDLSRVNLRDYAIVLMPNFALPQLPDESVDLYFNANSFSEMDADSARRYVSDIERIGKRYFMHVNHDARFTWPDEGGKTITNLIGSEIKPDPQKFKPVLKRRREFRSVQDEVFYLKHNADHHMFLFERSDSRSG